MKKKKRTDTIEYDRRVLDIQKWITHGIPYSLIIRKIVVDNDWCNTRNAKEMVKRAKAAWLKEAKENLEEEIAIKIDQLQQMKLELKPEYRGTPAGIQALMLIEKELIKLQRLNQYPVDLDSNNLNEQNNRVTVEIVPSPHPIARSEEEVII